MTEKTHILVGDLDKFFVGDKGDWKQRIEDGIMFKWSRDGRGWSFPRIDEYIAWINDDGSFFWKDCSDKARIEITEIFNKHDILVKPISVEEKKVEKHKEIIESIEKFLAELKAKYE